MSSKIVDPEVHEEPVEEQVNESLEALAVDIPNILFPYARLHAELITKSTGLHPVLMQEIDFKEIYYKEIGKKYK